MRDTTMALIEKQNKLVPQTFITH